MSLVDPRQARLNACLWLITCVDEITCNAFICDKLHTLAWRRYDGRYDGNPGGWGRSSQGPERVLQYLRTGFYTTLIASVSVAMLAG